MKATRTSLAALASAGRRVSAGGGGVRRSLACWIARLAARQAAVASLLAQSATLYLIGLTVLFLKRRR